MVASRIASGDTAGAADQLFRVFQNEWGGGTTIATVEELNHLVVSAGCAPLVRDALAETYRRAVARGVQVSIPSALRAGQSDIAPLAECLVDAIAASEKSAAG
ncbi:septation ring formation regulator [Chlorella sorokiniana]|uniref:Septation ring formation regulator n=1 Tax=Chlorella sorokiniana TaxID=3076 RepID=A0A2P6TSF1_CHLSO|nr:septation ring formation regulator [Chlorella sorokiniana]|eukprot:PRW56989.1 septation ring formation regulator [Chlorella sorokiniana]